MQVSTALFIALPGPLLTSLGSGIGKACALAYAREGAAGVAFSDINLEAATEAAEESKKLAKHPQYQPLVIKTDVSSQESVDEMIDTVVRKFPRLDYAVNSAGVRHYVQVNYVLKI